MLSLGANHPQFATNALRVQHYDALIDEIEGALLDGTTDQWLQRLHDAGIPAGRVRSLDELFAWEQARSQGLLIEVEHKALGRLVLPGPPLRFDGPTQPAVHHQPPPRLGEQNTAVLNWLDEVDRQPGVTRHQGTPSASKGTAARRKHSSTQC